jgi:hypothetical protein
MSLNAVTDMRLSISAASSGSFTAPINHTIMPNLWPMSRKIKLNLNPQ